MDVRVMKDSKSGSQVKKEPVELEIDIGGDVVKLK
jgi:hypothetical protein